MPRILVTGACGQIGTDLVDELRRRNGADNVIATGYRNRPPCSMRGCGPLRYLDVLSPGELEKLVFEYDVDIIFHLASILSAVGEKNPQLAYQINMQGLYNVLEISRIQGVKQVIWPSSIAAFGPGTPIVDTPNETIMRPTTMYGITKVAGELLVEYYSSKYGLDVRSLRLPGIVSSKAPPGGGTTDYSVEMYYEAVRKGRYTCFVKADTVLPLMYMPDAIKGLIELAETPAQQIKHRVYNIGAFSIRADQIEASIRKKIPAFKVDYQPDYRQEIADSWPRSLDDSYARKEWGWSPSFDLDSMTADMLKTIQEHPPSGPCT